MGEVLLPFGVIIFATLAVRMLRQRAPVRWTHRETFAVWSVLVFLGYIVGMLVTHANTILKALSDW